MKKKLSMLLVSLLAVVLAFALVACGGGKLTISDESLALTVGDTKQLTLKAGEEDVTASATWTSSEKKVVSVDSHGKVTAQGEGTATVTGSYEGASATCTVSVKAREVVTVQITDEAGKEIKDLTVERGKSITVKATTSNGSEVTWASDDTASVKVTPVDGQKNTATVEGVFPTSASVNVYATSGSSRASVAVTVIASSEQTDKGWYDMANRDESGNMIDNGSIGQNRTPVNRWSYWCDMTDWEGGNVEIAHAEYLGDDDSSQAGSVHFQYEVLNGGRKPDSCLQITYRAPKTTKATASSEPVNNPKGLLENGKYYKLTCTIESDATGTVVINGNTVELVKGTNNVVVYFLHSDDGAIHSPENGYGTAENQDYGPIQWTAFFLTTGAGLPKAELTISKLLWTESQAPTALEAPTVAVANGKVTVSDTANSEGVKNYTVGFFKNADDATPAYVITANKGEATSVDTSRWNNGEYFVKAKANPADGRFLESDWSAAADGKLTVANETVEYALENIAAADLGNDQWAYWSEGASTITDAKYKDGVITLKVTGLNNNWYSNQVFYKNSALQGGASYTLTCVINTTKAGHITLNGKVFNLEVGDNDIEVTFTESKAPDQASFSLQFGVQEDNVREIEDADITIKEVNWKEAEAPAPAGPDALTAGGEGDAKTANDGWKYWNANNEAGCTVTVTETKRENAVITLKFKGAGALLNYGFQLFYNDPATYPVGSQYKLTLHVKATYACTVTFNGQEVTFTAGEEKDVEVTFTYNFHLDNVVNYDYGISLFDMQVKIEDGKDYELTLSDIKWEKVGGSEQPGDDKNIVNGEEKREIWTGAETFVAVENPDTWVYWNDQNYNNSGCTVTVSKHELVDGVAYFTYSATGTNWYGFQVFYEKSGLTVGTAYTLTLVLHSNVAGKVTINDQQFDIVVGDNNLTVHYTESEAASFKLIMGTTDGAENPVTTYIASAEISLKDLAWTAAGQQQPEPPAGATQMTKVGSATEATEAGKWYYYAKENVTVTKAEVAADGTITFVYSGATAWDDVKIFYTPVGANVGETWNIVLTINFSHEGGTAGAALVTFNDKNSDKPGYTWGQEFSGIGHDFVKAEGPALQLTLGQETVANPDNGTVTLVLKLVSATKLS